MELATPPTMDEEHLDADHEDDVPLWFITMENLLGLLSPRGILSRVLEHELNVVSSDAPTLFEEAEADPSWARAMLEEMRSIEANNTSYLADLP
jgi:hypothetical protein